MNLDQFLKIIWLINGLALMGLMFVGGIFAIGEYASYASTGSYTSYTSESPSATATDISLDYDQPIPIYNTDMFLLGVGYTGKQTSSSNLHILPSFYSSDDRRYHNCVNIIFLDRSYKPVKTLLNKRAFVHSFEFPTNYQYGDNPDSTVRNITYHISLRDTNNDKDITDEDNADLYISDLDGGNFIQVTRDWDVTEYRLVDNSRRILIHYTPRGKTNDANNRTLFALYHIAEKKLETLTGIQESLNNIEKQLAP